MSNIHRIIANKRPLSHDEMAVLNVYSLIAIIIFRRELSVESIEFMVTLMRLNNIAQGNINVYADSVRVDGQTGATIAVYHQHMQNVARSMMR